MVEAFKTEKKETIYAVTGTKKKEEILKQLAIYKKESLASVKRKFNRFETGYMIQKGGFIELYADEIKKGGIPCVIARK